MESARSRAKSTEVGERGNLCIGEAYGHDINNCSPPSPFSYPNLVLAGDANGKEPHGWHRVYAKDAGKDVRCVQGVLLAELKATARAGRPCPCVDARVPCAFPASRAPPLNRWPQNERSTRCTAACRLARIHVSETIL